MRIFKGIIVVLVFISVISILLIQKDGAPYEYLDINHLLNSFTTGWTFDFDSFFATFDEVVDLVNDVSLHFENSFKLDDSDAWWMRFSPWLVASNLFEFLSKSLPSIFSLIIALLRLAFALLKDGVNILSSFMDTLYNVLHPVSVAPSPDQFFY